MLSKLDAPIVNETDKLLSVLNPEQRAAVEATEGPVLVLAGAGTGKTRVLTTRIAHILMSKLAYPGEILAVTFTNKAAREMVERVNHLTGASQSLWLGTFHSIGVRIIRRHAEKLGLTSNFTILDQDDQLRLIKTILGEQNIDDKQLPPKLFGAIIQRWKDQGLTPEKISANEDRQQAGGHAPKIYKLYQDRLRQLNAADFGDLILHMLTLFSTHEDVLAEYARRFKYILVDEYQDTNVAQYLWLRLLASVHKNICCVGDDDQSIYSWRGAEVGNILRFERDFPNATVVRLECNYRSTPHILAAASAIIANNKGRLGKTLWTSVSEGEKISLKGVWDESEEARFVGEEIEALQHKKVSLNHMAILVRAGFQTRAFEKCFRTMGIPCRIMGDLRFYERREIRDAVAYLRVIASSADDLAFERIINLPRRGIGPEKLSKIRTTARMMNTSFYNAVVHLLNTAQFKGKSGIALQTLINSCERWRKQLGILPLGEIVDLMLEESGYRAMWQQENSPDTISRLENLKELSNDIGGFETIDAFLEQVSLDMEAAKSGMNTDMVSVMTLHRAKGLEFDVVFLPGWEEGVFPHQRAIGKNDDKDIEEERRLAYVGITRARKKLYISHADSRRIYDKWSNGPSRFIGELPDENVDKLSGGVYGNVSTGKNWQDEVKAILSSPPPQGGRPGGGRVGHDLANNAPLLTSPLRGEEKFRVGKRIFHQKFGYGRVVSISGNHIEIDFEKAGRKKVLADYIEAV